MGSQGGTAGSMGVAPSQGPTVWTLRVMVIEEFWGWTRVRKEEGSRRLRWPLYEQLAKSQWDCPGLCPLVGATWPPRPPVLGLLRPWAGANGRRLPAASTRRVGSLKTGPSGSPRASLGYAAGF